MNTMGIGCSSLHRNSGIRNKNKMELNYECSQVMNGTRNLCRHYIKTELPNDSIATLYPLHDNYVEEDGGKSRSPKTLVDLCIDAVCRNLPRIEGGDLPSGIPQDLVDGILASLVNRSALNATTLKALRRCELSELPLSRSRGVSDDWLYALNENRHVSNSNGNSNSEDQDALSCQSVSSSDSASFQSAVSSPKKLSSLKSCNDASYLFLPLTCGGEGLEFHSVTSQLSLLDLRGSQQVTDKGLLQLTSLRCLEVAMLDNCYSITGKGLSCFRNSYRLHTLSLSNCRCLADEAISNILHINSITALTLNGCRCITDFALEQISNLTNIEKLELSQCDLITDDGLDHLESLYYLEELALGWCRLITDRGIGVLTSQPHRDQYLLSLSLARCQITDDGVGHLSNLTALHALDLNGCSNIGSAALGDVLQKLDHLEMLDVSYCPYIIRSSWQGGINSLRSLDLCYSAVKNSHLARLSSLPALEELNLDSCPIGDWALAHFVDNNVVPNLKSLNLADTDISDQALIPISKMNKLQHLSLFYCEITNSGLQHLSQMESLEVLNLDSREIGDTGMFHLRNLKNLKCLDVFSGRITDNGCAHIAKIQSLETLELCGGGVGDFGCHHLSMLKNLTSLNLSQNERITNIGAVSLSSLTNLKALNLSNTRATADALLYFKGLTHLQSLAMYGCKGIQNCSRVNDLQKDLPNLKCMRLRVCSDGDGTIDDGESDDSEEIMYDEDDDGLSFVDDDDEESDRYSNISYLDDGAEDDDVMDEDGHDDSDEEMDMES